MPHSLTADLQDRPLKDLRISVTDRCNYRCGYCMPHDEYAWSPPREILTFEEIIRLSAIFISLGVERIRLTGGEPLLRRDLYKLVQMLNELPELTDLSLTTNGSLFSTYGESLAKAGLTRINISLDTLRPDRFRSLTQRGDLVDVLKGIEVARKLEMNPIKINTVVIRGTNDDELIELAEFGRLNHVEMRFIEYLNVGNANDWSMTRTVPKNEIIETINTHFPLEEVGRFDGRAPSVDYRYADGAGRIGVIGSLTEPFCSSCTRARLTADGRLVTCLFSEQGVDLKELVRSEKTDDQISEAIQASWSYRNDRYSDQRWESIKKGDYKKSRKIEMITLGG